jgi:hypothetical protein
MRDTATTSVALRQIPAEYSWRSTSVLFYWDVALLAQAVGATLRWPELQMVSRYMIVFRYCLLAGWLLGQFAGYKIYRDKIIAA